MNFDPNGFNEEVYGLHIDPLSNQLLVNNHYQVANVEIDENSGWLNILQLVDY